MGDEQLFVVENHNEEDEFYNPSFVIKDELFSISEKSYEEVYKLFLDSSFDSSVSIPLYQILWQDFVIPSSEENIQLIHLLLLAQRLSNRIDQLDCDRVVTGPLSKEFEAVVVDVANHHEIEVNVEYGMPSFFDRIVSYTKGVCLLVPYLFDLLFSLIWKVWRDLPQETETIFIPGIGRIESIRPVIEEHSSDFAVVTTPLTLAGFRSERADDELKIYDPIPIGLFCTTKIFAQIVQFLFIEMPRELLVDRRLEQSMASSFSAQLGLSVPYSVSYGISDLDIPAQFRVLTYYFITKEAVDQMKCEAIVVGSGAPCGRSILAGANDTDTDMYHVRHSLITGFTPSPPFGAVEFVEGESAIDYLQNKSYISDTTQFIPAGRPYLAELSDERTNHPCRDKISSDHDCTHIVIATQPFSDSIRTEFVSTILDSIDHACSSVEVTIKTHPSEDPDFYKEQFGDRDITIQSSKLRPLLSDAEIVVTISSNVGLEGIVLNAACVSVNFWEPFVRSMPHYDHANSIPVLENPTDVAQFFSTLEQSDIENLQTNQCQYFEENIVTEDCARAIAEVIAGKKQQ